jgi:hypothetical protein
MRHAVDFDQDKSIDLQPACTAFNGGIFDLSS